MASLRRLFVLYFPLLYLLHTLVSCLTLDLPESIKEKGEKHTKLSNLRPHFLTSVITKPIIQDGLSFSRKIKHINDASFQLSLDNNHCISHDVYGDNACHYDWGEQVLGNYNVTLDTNIQHGDYMTGSFHVRQETCFDCEYYIVVSFHFQYSRFTLFHYRLTRSCRMNSPVCCVESPVSFKFQSWKLLAHWKCLLVPLDLHSNRE